MADTLAQSARVTAFVDVAAAIGRRLATDAIWHEDRCNWIGARIGISAETRTKVEYQAALEASLYEGTSGVALFLAELAIAADDAPARQTALGAIRHALRTAATDARGSGLYSGSAGIAFVAAHVGHILADEELTQSAGKLAATIAATSGGVDDHDVIDGRAGIILALLRLARLVDDPRLADAAIALGDSLIQEADSTGGGLSWPTKGSVGTRNLTGFAHGAAGIGYALVELGAGTVERRFTRAAAAAFDYEQAMFDPESGNWPDFRDFIRRGPAGEPGCSAYWCHGGPGIALSRLGALERIGGQRWFREAEAGLAVAREALTRTFGRIGGDFTLCHGLAGLAEIVVEVERGLNPGSSPGVAHDVAAWGADEYARRGTWPCGTGAHESQGLMLGLSGIGYFYLRAAGHPAPSMLTPFKCRGRG